MVDLDRTTGYVGEPGEEEQFAHPRGGDTCTSAQLNTASWRRLTGEPAPMPMSTVYVDARTELAHRRLLAAGRADVDYRLAEELVRLLAAAPTQHRAQNASARRGRPIRPSARGAGTDCHP